MTELPKEEQINNANVLLADSSYLQGYGECRGWTCPVCDEIAHKIGDLRNPCVNVYGEKMCDDCKGKLRKLIGK